MLLCAMRRSDGGPHLCFQLHVAMPDRGDWLRNEKMPEIGSRATHRLVTLQCVCGPAGPDDPSPCLTIMLPSS
jgi:hypothetical protein